MDSYDNDWIFDDDLFFVEDDDECGWSITKILQGAESAIAQ